MVVNPPQPPKKSIFTVHMTSLLPKRDIPLVCDFLISTYSNKTTAQMGYPTYGQAVELFERAYRRGMVRQTLARAQACM